MNGYKNEETYMAAIHVANDYKLYSLARAQGNSNALVLATMRQYGSYIGDVALVDWDEVVEDCKGE